VAAGAYCLSATTAAARTTESTSTIVVVVAAATGAKPRNVWASSEQLQQAFSIFDTASTELRAAVVGAVATVTSPDAPRIDAEIVEHAAVERRTNQLAASVWVAGNSANAPAESQAEKPASASIQYTAVAERQTSQLAAPVTVAGNSANEFVEYQTEEPASASFRYTGDEISFLWRRGTRRELLDAGLISEWYPPPKENWFGEDDYDEFSDC